MILVYLKNVNPMGGARACFIDQPPFNDRALDAISSKCQKKMLFVYIEVELIRIQTVYCSIKALPICMCLRTGVAPP